MVIELTKAEGVVLCHRLEVPEAIGECLTDDPQFPYTEQQVWDRCGQMEDEIRDHQTLTFNLNDALDYAIVEDLLGGNVMGAIANEQKRSHNTREKMEALRWMKAIHSLNDKFGKLGFKYPISLM